MSGDPSRDHATRAMDDFADRTGLTSDRPPRRYLWTDAFAVCNYLGLHVDSGRDRFLAAARALVDQVHHVLGRHRADDPRRGWISGLTDEAGSERPTAGGLRIGKPRPERGPSERYDPGAEWDRDGQYYHYLTKWMFALNRMWRVTGEEVYHRQAVDLARAAHRGFMTSSPTGPRLHWKVSIDLSRPLVPSSGHHDPLDGVLIASGLSMTGPEGSVPDLLARETEELMRMCERSSWVTDDPLGAGGLLVAALRCRQLVDLGHPTGRTLLGRVMRDSLASLERLSDFPFLRRGADQRLAFRELGLALGLRAGGWLRALGPPSGDHGSEERILEDLEGFEAVGPLIVDFWSRDEPRRTRAWADHRDISEVMWATCLVPRGFLEL